MSQPPGPPDPRRPRGRGPRAGPVGHRPPSSRPAPSAAAARHGQRRTPSRATSSSRTARAAPPGAVRLRPTASPAVRLPPAGLAATGSPGYPHDNGKATAALWTGIGSLVLAFCCGLGILGIVPIVLGVKARGEIRRTGGQQEGDGMALAGIITGAIAIVLSVALVALIVMARGRGNTSYNIDQTRVGPAPLRRTAGRTASVTPHDGEHSVPAPRARVTRSTAADVSPTVARRRVAGLGILGPRSTTGRDRPDVVRPGDAAPRHSRS